jgi:hypothetical protein
MATVALLVLSARQYYVSYAVRAIMRVVILDAQMDFHGQRRNHLSRH